MVESAVDLLEYKNEYNLISKVLKIATDDDDILKIVANEIPIDQIKSLEIQQLIVDMIETMKAAPGIGLAAPQIYVSSRIIVFYLPSSRDDINHVGVPLSVLINPIIEPLDEEETYDFEGCLRYVLYSTNTKMTNIIMYSIVFQAIEVRFVDTVLDSKYTIIVLIITIIYYYY